VGLAAVSRVNFRIGFAGVGSAQAMLSIPQSNIPSFRKASVGPKLSDFLGVACRQQPAFGVDVLVVAGELGAKKEI